MLKIINNKSEVNFAQLAAVYEESISLSGKRQYRLLSKNMQLLCAQQDFYLSVEQFYLLESSLYAVWMAGNRYVAALRVEAYCDGYLITGLETATADRCNGYASSLLSGVLRHLARIEHVKIYSHIARNNFVSLRVHKNCGFNYLLDYAVFLDGSVSYDAVTYCYQK